jgi:hypothetical protein
MMTKSSCGLGLHIPIIHSKFATTLDSPENI